MNKTGLVLISAFLGLQIASVHAKMYRWVDDSGNVSYSQTPPADGRSSTTIKPAAGPSAAQIEAAKSRLNQKTEANAVEKEKQLEAKNKAQEDAQATNTQKGQCDIAKKNLKMMEQRPRNALFQIGDTDEHKRFSNDEWEAEYKKYKDAIKEMCKK